MPFVLLVLVDQLVVDESHGPIVDAVVFAAYAAYLVMCGMVGNGLLVRLRQAQGYRHAEVLPSAPSPGGARTATLEPEQSLPPFSLDSEPLAIRRSALEPALLVLLLWNSLAGIFAVFRPGGLFGDDPMAVDRWGLLAPLPPTAHAGLWLTAVGLCAVVAARRGRPGWHVLAVLFYLPQVLAMLAPTRIMLWTGIYVAVPVHVDPKTLLLVNLASFAPLVAHAFQAVRLPDPMWARIQERLRFLREASLPRCTLAAIRGSIPLSRAAVARRFTVIMTVAVWVSCLAAGLLLSRALVVEFASPIALVLFSATLLCLALAYLGAGELGRGFSTWRGIVVATFTVMFVLSCAATATLMKAASLGPVVIGIVILWAYGLPLLALNALIGGIVGSWLERCVHLGPERPHEVQTLAWARRSMSSIL